MIRTKGISSLAFAGSLLMSSSIWSATEMNSSKVMSFSISNKGLTRIAIENGSIKDMFVYPGSASKSINHHASGNLFVAPEGLEGPVYLTLISDGGESQDLKLSFVNRAPKPLLFKVKEEKVASKDQIARWVDVALMGEAPRHFRRESPIRQKITTSTTVAQESVRFSNGVYNLSLWDVSSTVDTPVSLKPDLYIDGDEAGKLKDLVLPARGKTRLVIISKNKEKHS